MKGTGINGTDGKIDNHTSEQEKGNLNDKMILAKRIKYNFNIQQNPSSTRQQEHWKSIKQSV